MKMLEFMAKDVFGQNGIAVPRGRVACNGEEAGLKLVQTEIVEEQKVRVAFLPVGEI